MANPDQLLAMPQRDQAACRMHFQKMAEIPYFFVTPHAVTQFQLRIAALDEAAVRDVIMAGIRESTNVSVLPDGVTLRVRTRHPFPYEFRAYCVFDEQRGHRVVTTIVRGDSSVTRKRRRKDRKARSNA